MPHTIGIDARKLEDFGIGTYIRHLLGGLAEIDRDNRYLVLVAPEQREQLWHLPDNFQLVPESARVYSLRELATVSWKLFRLRLDLYHATHYVLPAVVPSRAVVTIHDIIHLLYPEFLPSAMAYFYAQRMIGRSLLRGDQIIADSQNTKADLVEFFQVDGEKIRVVYPGVAERFRRELPREQIDGVLERYSIRRPYLLFVGNPKPHKNLDRVVRAFAEALGECAFEGELVCVGDRGGRDLKTRQRAEQLGIADRVRLVGHVGDDELPAIYQAAELFLYPTLYEGFGLPVVEAMASGVPVITSNSSALKEVAEGYADLVNPVESGEIAHAITHCMTDPDHREALRALGRRRAEDFCWKRTAERTLEVYRKALGAGAGESS